MPLNVRNIDINGLINYSQSGASSTPVANFSGTPTSGTGTLTVNFTDSSTNNPTSWLWDFKNDGTATSTLQNPSYTYSTPGTYSVKLTATNSSGSNSITKTNYITVADVTPIAGFNASPTSGTIPLNVTFTNASTGTNLTYAWTFGDGTTSTSTNPSKTYSNTGSYTVTLTASNTAGTSTSTRTNLISASDVTPIASFSANPTTGEAPLSVTFNSSSSVGTNLTYAWDFTNDGVNDTTTTATTASYTYSNSGVYSVKLTASNSAGVSTATSLNLISASVPMDPYFNYTTLLLGGQGTNNSTNTLFVDSSSNNFTVTNVGSVNQGAFSPFGVDAGYWSNYFNGTNDNLNVANNAAFSFGTGDFTIEAWVFPMANNSRTQIIGCTNGTTLSIDWYIRRNNSEYIEFYAAGTTFTTTTTVPLNKWTHVAVVRSGTTLTIYLNGINGGGGGTLSNNLSTSQPLVIGNALNNGGSAAWTGYISNARVVKGTAIYTSGFNPSTTPLTAVSGTSLLTCQSNRFVDNSSNAFTVSIFGGPNIDSFGPFVPASQYTLSDGGAGYFSNSYVSVASNDALNFGTGDFTTECWVYVPTGTTEVAVFGKWAAGSDNYLLRFDSNKFVFYYNGGSITQSDTTPYNSWTHVAVTRSGTALRLFVNGVSKASASTGFNSSNATAFAMGAYGSDLARFTGYISNLRVIKGSAAYTADFTPPTAPVATTTQTSLLLNATNAGMFDSTGKMILTQSGDAKISTAQKKFGSSSVSFTSGSLTSTPNTLDPNFVFGTGDFTVECWIRPSVVNVGQAIFDLRNPNTQDLGFAIYLSNTGVPYAGTANVNYITGGSGLSANTWYHIALCRSGSNMRLFVDGTQVGSTYNASSRNFTNGIPLIGSGQNGNFNGYIQDLRVTKGYARYTGNFTPPGQLTN